MTKNIIHFKNIKLMPDQEKNIYQKAHEEFINNPCYGCDHENHNYSGCNICKRLSKYMENLDLSLM